MRNPAMRSFAVAVMLMITAPTLAMAAEKSPGDHLDAVLQEVLDAISLVLRAVPQYELPEVLPNGDIIIRRIPPDEPPEAKPEAPAEDDGPGIKT